MAKNIVDFLQLQKLVLRKNFTRVGGLLEHEHLLGQILYISINILNKILQMVVPKTSDYTQMVVK